jgi:hypothetical protein
MKLANNGRGGVSRDGAKAPSSEKKIILTLWLGVFAGDNLVSSFC